MSIKIPIPEGKTVEVDEPQRHQFPNTLGGAIEYTLAHWIFAILNVMGEGIGSFWASVLIGFMETIEPDLVRYFNPLLEFIRREGELPPEFDEFFANLQNPDSEAAAFILQQAGGAAISGGIGGVLNAVMAPAVYGLNDLIRPLRPDVSAVVNMYYRGEINTATMRDWLADQGYPTLAIDAFIEILRPRPGELDLIREAWRKDRPPESIRTELLRRGWTKEDIDTILTVSEGLPSVADLVQFAVREAWRDDIAAQFGYDEDRPPQFAKWLARQGYDPDWAEKYWRAHWRLPSINQGFEMLHRDVIDDNTLDILLRAADIPRFWRESLKEISFRPFTRVDVRRMHRLGVLSDEELVRAYRDIGFDVDKARAMAEFTIQYNTRSEREFSEGEIRRGYRDGALSREDALALLMEMGQSQQHAEYILALEDYRREQNILEARIDIVKDRFVEGEFSETDASVALGELGLRGDQVGLLLEEWWVARRKKRSRPTKKDIEDFYVSEIVSRAEAIELLRNRRYSEENIQRYLALWDKKKGE